MQSPSKATREWITFTDPADPEHEIRADLSFLLSSWSCIFGNGCQGIVPGRADEGCCSHGAFFTDKADEKRVKRAARQLTAEDWQNFGTRPLAEDDELDDEPARRTATLNDACIYLNRPGSPQGAGCALHKMALRTGVHPLEVKPDVCWQLPISRAEELLDDGGRVTTVTEFGRSSWGEGGADFHWWCTESKAAMVARRPLYRTYSAELTELLGAPSYRELARLCARRERGTRPTLPLV